MRSPKKQTGPRPTNLQVSAEERGRAARSKYEKKRVAKRTPQKAPEPKAPPVVLPEICNTYPPPKSHPIFQAKWGELIESVVQRDNFRPGHLNALAILCDCFVEYEKMTAFLDANGYTYESIGRHGLQVRQYPQVKLRQTALNSIKSYLLLLDLRLHKDKDLTAPEEEKEWK